VDVFFLKHGVVKN